MQGQVVGERKGEQGRDTTTPASRQQGSHGQRQPRHVGDDDELVRGKQPHHLAQADQGHEVCGVGGDAQPPVVVRRVGRTSPTDLGKHVGGSHVEGQVEPRQKPGGEKRGQEKRQQQHIANAETPRIGNLARNQPGPSPAQDIWAGLRRGWPAASARIRAMRFVAACVHDGSRVPGRV